MEIAISIPSAIPSPSPTGTAIPRRTASPSLFFSSSNSSFLKNTLTHQRRDNWSRVPGRTTTRDLSCQYLFGLGVPELVVIAGVAALVFGPKKLPEVGRSIGKTVKSFQQAAKEFETELKKEPDSLIVEPPDEKPTAVSGLETEVEVSNAKESS